VFINVLCIELHYEVHLKETEMGENIQHAVKNENRIKHFRCITGRYHLKYLGVNGRSVLKCI